MVSNADNKFLVLELHSSKFKLQTVHEIHHKVVVESESQENWVDVITVTSLIIL